MTTYHALQRTEERAGLKGKSAERLIANAIRHGKEVNAFVGKERNYLLREEGEGTRVVIHSAYCFIISEDNNCITMYPVPEWFERKRNGGKRAIISGKNYTRLWNLFEHELEYESA